MAALLERGAEVRCLTHSKEKISALPRRVEGAVGDLERPSTLKGVGRPAALLRRGYAAETAARWKRA